MLWIFFVACSGGDCVSTLSVGEALALEGCVELALEAELRGSGELTVRFEQAEDGSVVPVVSAGEAGRFEALVLSGPLEVPGEGPLRLWRQGYQSWWWSGVTELEPLELEEGLPVVGGDGDGASAIAETPGTSWWVGLVGRPGGPSVLLGSLAATRTKTWFAFEEERAWAVWGGRGESIPLEPGEELRLDPLWLATGADAWELHRDYARAAAAHNGVEERGDLPPVGWATWTVHYAEVTEEDVRGALEQAEGLDLIQLDDGWQQAWGQWEPDEGFPGWATLARDIAASGRTPGLWMAPFYVEEDTALAQAHPDWFVTRAGEPIRYTNFGGPAMRVLDPTHPDAAAWLHEQLAARVDEGWAYFKLDFLYAAAQEGERYTDVTGAEAYQVGMAILRDAIGDRFLLACGAPMLPSLGWADAYRTGADIAFTFMPDGDPAYLRWQARSTAARGWQNGTWWWVDADQMVFADQEPTGVLAANLVSGGAWLLGDALDQSPALALDPELLGLLGVSGRPLDPLAWPSGLDVGPIGEAAAPDDQVPPVWRLDSGHTVLLNLSEQSLELEAPGGTELFSGERQRRGSRVLEAGEAEIWTR